MAAPYDLLVIGAGPAGHAAALRAALRGARVAILENEGWGGTCTHRGCVPTKALLACSLGYARLAKLGRLGVRVENPSFDYGAMKRHQELLVRISAEGVRRSLAEAGVALFDGEGRILAPGEVEWKRRGGPPGHLRARFVVIASGSVPALPPGVRPSERILTSDGLLSQGRLPGSVLVVGGGVIGVEFATLLAELGVRVTLVEMAAQLLPGEEREAAAFLQGVLTNLGVAVRTGVRVETIRETASGVALTVAADSAGSGEPVADSSPPAKYGRDPHTPPPDVPRELAADCALLCTGRSARLRPAELDGLGIRHDRRGIAVDEWQRTSVRGIHAIGDVTGGPMLAHRAIRQGRVLAERLFGSRGAGQREETIPSVVYTHPPLARVGLTEAEALGKGIAVEIHRAEFAANIAARTNLCGSGFVKLLFDRGRLAGATIAGDQAGELIAPLGLAMQAGLDRAQLADWIIPHPTLSEVLGL